MKVAAAAFCRTVDDVRSDRRAFQVTCSSTHFDEVDLPRIDCHTLTLAAAPERHPSRSRGDSDLTRSSVWAANLFERADVDPMLKQFLKETVVLRGRQIQALVDHGRIDPSGLG